jgi:hypothetical protein
VSFCRSRSSHFSWLNCWGDTSSAIL